MNIGKVKRVHFIGIGGIGMSALARYFHQMGLDVSGYDKTPTPLTTELQKEGMHIYFEENLDFLPDALKDHPTSEENLVVYTPAVPETHVERSFFQKKNANVWKRAEILGEISKEFPTVGIAGTHGKTTTTSLLTYICQQAGLNFISFVGGINENFKTNLVIQGKAEFMITEADEFDRSFLQLSPHHAIVTSMDADHLDVYENASNMAASFVEYADSVDKKGLLLVSKKIENNMPANAQTYDLEGTANCFAEKVRFEDGKFHFSYRGKNRNIPDLELNLPGYHNLENAIAAIRMSIELGAQDTSIRKALKTYCGVKRRFEYIVNKNDFKYIDDYAHHPEEIRAVISSLKKMYPGKTITGIFQPHLYSRTKDLADEFAESLSEIEDLILIDIYPAREKPMPGITSQWLLEKVKSKKKTWCTKEDLVQELDKHSMDILVTLGAGDIDQLVKEIKNKYA